MQTVGVVLVLFCSFLSSSFAQIEYGYCALKGTANDPGVTGSVTFVTNGNRVDVTVSITGITVNPNSLHGLHVHQWGDISNTTNGLSVGGHFDINNQSHACENTTARQTGDTGNWQATGGVISANKSLDLMGLTADNSVIGRAVVLHGLTDDCGPVNLGNAGPRLAFCVIGVGNPATKGQTVNNAKNGATTGIPTRAVCELAATTGNSVSGRVWFEQDSASGPTTVKAMVNGITGNHGFHIHVYGDLSTNNGTNAGGHFNPNSVLHGIPPFTPRHVGDMGMIYYYSGNVAYYQYSNDLITLSGTNNVLGRAVIVHANPDDCTNPVGNAGSRLAQCVIGIADPVAYNPVAQGFPASGVPPSQNSSACTVVSTGTVVATTTASGATGSTNTASTAVAGTTTTTTTTAGGVSSTSVPAVTTGFLCQRGDNQLPAVGSGCAVVLQLSCLVP